MDSECAVELFKDYTADVVTCSIAVVFHTLYCFCLDQSVLRRRDAIQMEYDMLLEELCRKNDDKDEVTLFSDLKLNPSSD